MNKLKAFRWPAALLLTAATAFYSGHYWGTAQVSRQHDAMLAINSCQLIDLLKTGRTEEALDLQTKHLSLQVQFMNQRVHPSSPVAMFTYLPMDFQPSAMRNVVDLRRNHPDVALNSRALAHLARFKDPLAATPKLK